MNLPMPPDTPRLGGHPSSQRGFPATWPWGPARAYLAIVQSAKPSLPSSFARLPMNSKVSVLRAEPARYTPNTRHRHPEPCEGSKRSSWPTPPQWIPRPAANDSVGAQSRPFDKLRALSQSKGCAQSRLGGIPPTLGAMRIPRLARNGRSKTAPLQEIGWREGHHGCHSCSPRKPSSLLSRLRMTEKMSEASSIIPRLHYY